MVTFQQTDREAIASDAFSSEGKSPIERTAIFLDLVAAVDEITQSLTPEERQRRLRIADQLDPRPEPWWSNFRAEAMAEYQCQTSSS